MVRRVSRRVHATSSRVAGGDDVAVARAAATSTGHFAVALGPGHLQKAGDAEALAQRRCAGRVIDVPVRDQHLAERRSGERFLDAVEVSALAGPGVDQRRDTAGNQPRPVAVAGDRPGVEREDRNGAFKRTPSAERKRNRGASAGR